MIETALSMRAKYNSTCPSCGQPIVAGDVMALHNRRAYCSASCLPDGVAIVNRTEREHPNDRRERHNAANCDNELLQSGIAIGLESTEARIERMHKEKMAVLKEIATALGLLVSVENELKAALEGKG